MSIGQDILNLLKSQLGNYKSMKLAVDKQTGFITESDVGGLLTGTSEVRSLMRKIRDKEAALRPLRQSWTSLGIDRPVVEKREIDTLVAAIRGIIGTIKVTRDQNAELLETSLDSVKKQMAGLKSQAKVTKAYYPKPKADARFIDQSN